ncbi:MULTISPECIES: M20 metallopeptidase family protein [unclassified Streptomyces]|uniref:M20 metallopeptidase family protein n=1 Tax=unclassified Streptomyces TaxID=2593676 RepID=UPI002E3099A0|nr:MULTISPECIES: M20 family metallopeptidase [unclassified Streptomyces]WUC68165.1 M20 family metallopeptidase [Streptomyces sp. NBC_00539]
MSASGEGAAAPRRAWAGLLTEAHTLLPETVALRRSLHRFPELGLDLPRTQGAVLDALADLGLEIATGSRLTSVTATLEGASPGRTVLLRADMDALPLQEETGLGFASQVPGAMHACGHDAHTAMLVTAARLVAARRSTLAGRVVFMFQPAEESGGGARHMIDEGVLELAGGRVESAFALHITTRFDSGTIHLRPGPTFAASDLLHITVRGRGGHASAPHLALDPVPVACEIVQAIQAMVTRTIDVFDPAVVTVASLHAGTTTNVIPACAEIHGTVRSLSPATRRLVHEGITRVAHHVAAAHAATAEVTLTDGYPPVINDPARTRLLHATASALLGPDRVHHLAQPLMGAEDFSYVLQQVPGAMAFLGARPPGLPAGETPDIHSNRVVFDENALATGAALYAATALEATGQHGPPT